MVATPTNGVTDTVLQPAAPIPQAFEGVAHTCPELDPTVTLIVEVPCPEFIDHPDGTVQSYDVALFAFAV